MHADVGLEVGALEVALAAVRVGAHMAADLGVEGGRRRGLLAGRGPGPLAGLAGERGGGEGGMWRREVGALGRRLFFVGLDARVLGPAFG